MNDLKDFMKPEILWLMAGVLMLFLEFILPGIVIVFFGIGACLVALVCRFTDISLNTQLIIFLVSSVFLLLVLRKWVKSIFLGRTTLKGGITDSMSQYIGQRAIVKTGIPVGGRGKIEFFGTQWDAEADEDIAEGTAVEVVGKSSILMKVKRINK
jgi:membrane protein implicated in regulation of membrane protease activity